MYRDDQARQVISALQAALPTGTKTEAPRSTNSSEKVSFTITPIAVVMISAMSRVLRERSRQLRRETGAATLEYIGMTLVAAALVAGLLLTGTGARLADRFSASVCQILQVENCPTFDAAAAGDPSVATKTPLEQATQGKYVAMGDGYSSGEGAKQYIEGTNFDDRNDL